MSGDRENMLGRIAEALRVPAPLHHEAAARAVGKPSVTAPFREWLPPGGATMAEQFALFAKQCAVLRAEFRECLDAADAAAHIGELAREHGWKRIALHTGQLTSAVAALLPTELDQLLTEAGYDKDALEGCDAGITECEVLVAQTGSVCVTSTSSGGRALSVLPPHHVVLARRDQLVPDLTAAFALLASKYAGSYPSFLSFISGPSRTGDIERILVLGAHGPKMLTILLLP